MGFFSKLKDSLEKTKKSLFTGIETVVLGYANIDDEMYDDLEAVMLTGDIGIETTDYLLEQKSEVTFNKSFHDFSAAVRLRYC